MVAYTYIQHAFKDNLKFYINSVRMIFEKYKKENREMAS